MRRLALPLLILLAAAPAPAAPARVRPLLIRAARAIGPDGFEIAPAAVLVEGEWITAVAREIDPPEGAVVLSRPEATVVPGLVDAHAWLDREGRLSEPVRPATPGFRAIDAGIPSVSARTAELADGVTTICVAPSDACVLGGRPAVLLADGTVLREEAGWKLALGGPALGAERYPASHWGALDLLRRGPAGAALDAAEKGGETVLVRADDSADVVAFLALVAERPGMRAALVGGREAGARSEAIAAAGAAVVWGPAPLDATEKVLGGPAMLHESGVALAFGTDGRPGTLRRTAVIAHRAGLSRAATLRALTTGAAGILALGDATGRLAKGARADFTLMDGDPLDLSAKVTDAFVGGKRVPLDGEDPR